MSLPPDQPWICDYSPNISRCSLQCLDTILTDIDLDSAHEQCVDALLALIPTKMSKENSLRFSSTSLAQLISSLAFHRLGSSVMIHVHIPNGLSYKAIKWPTPGIQYAGIHGERPALSRVCFSADRSLVNRVATRIRGKIKMAVYLADGCS